FLILAALYLSLRGTEANRRIWWTALLTAAALVHAYIFVMVGLLWLASLVQVRLAKQCTIRTCAMECCVTLAVVGLACWQAGYFVFSDGLDAARYGHYRMNLLSIVDSSGWSYVLGDIPQSKGEYEGFNFLGLGVIFIAI